MSIAETKQWTSEAGPRQTKAVEKAISALRWRGKAKIQIHDHDRSEVVGFSDPQSPESVEAEDSIGERFGWTITRENHKEVREAIEQATRDLNPPEEDCRTTPEERQRREELAEENRRKQEEAERKGKAAEAAIMAKRPPNAAALIVAELDEDKSDIMTDYFHHTTARRVAIGWRTGKREDFRQLRKAAGGFPETAHMGPGCDVWSVSMPDDDGIRRPVTRDGWFGFDRATFTTEAEALAFIESKELENAETHCESVEHRENYSMGGGNYLKAGHSNSSAWRVCSYPLEYSIQWSELEDALPVPEEPEAVEAGTGAEVQKHYHDKRGYDFWLVVLSDRVDRDTFDRLRSAAKTAGGWYSRAWRGTPGGFGFKVEADASAFASSITDGEAKPASPAKQRSDQAATLRERADKWDAEADDKLRPRETNTPRKLKFARSAEQDGTRLRRAAGYLRAFADHSDAGTLPGCLAGFRPTKENVFRAAMQDTDDVSNGYHGYSVENGKWRDESPEAVALRSLADIQEPDAEALKVRRMEDDLRGSKIPGFFPTPPEVIEQMLDEADIDHCQSILEPSAGKGDIIDAIAERMDGATLVTCCEIRPALREILDTKGYSVVGEDFLEFRHPASEPIEATAKGGHGYDRIVMNPPFERGQDAQHVRHAYKLLNDGGRLVAIMANGAAFQKFSPWLEDKGGWSRELDPKAFAGKDAFRQTGVNCRLVVIDK